MKSILKSLIEQQQTLMLAHASTLRDSKSEPNPETNLIQKLKNLFVPQPAAPQTDEDVIINGIRNMLEGQINTRDNGSGHERRKRESYNSDHTGNTHIDAVCYYCKKIGHYQRFCPQRKDFITFCANKEQEKSASVKLVHAVGASKPSIINLRIKPSPNTQQPQ